MDAVLEKILADAGLTDEEKAKVTDAFSIEKLGKVISEGVMRKSTYERKVGEVEARRKTLEENWEKANNEFLRMQTDLESTQSERDEAAKKLKEAEDKLSAAPQIDPAKVLTPEQFDTRMREYAAGQTAFFGDVLEIVDEHQSLFGTRINGKKLIQEALEAKKAPLDYWQEKYNVQAKRDEVAKAEDDKKQKDAEERGYQKRIAEEANPSTRPLSASKSPFFETKEQGKSPWDEDGTPQHEADLLQELTKVARG